MKKLPETMKKLSVILLSAALPFTAPAANQWSATAGSTIFDDGANWTGDGVPGELSGTADIRVDGYATNSAVNFPVVDSAFSHNWGVVRFRGPGLHFTQTGGYLQWLNGSGTSSRGFSIFSRPVAFPIADPTNHPTVARITGGTMVTDAIGVGTTGGLNSGTYFTVGGDYTLDSGTYKNWQNTPGDNAYGWGRLEIRGGTLIVRPNLYAYPAGYSETDNPYWIYYDTNAPTADVAYRVYDIAISTDSHVVISDNGKLIAPLKIYIEDRDVLAQLQYYQGIGRFQAGPGQTLQYDSFPGTNELNEVWGGYFTVTAVPAPFAGLQQLGASSLAVSGLVGRDYQIESTDDLTQPIAWNVRTNFTLTTSPQTWNDPTPSSSNRYYRAVLLPLP